jgi:DNA-binding MarR family transcriptional regulator
MKPSATLLPTDDDLAVRLRLAVGRISRLMRRTGGDLTPTEASVLMVVARIGPVRMSELAHVEGLNPTMLSRVVAGLVARGVLDRQPDPDDGRAALVAATAEGAALWAQIRRERAEVLGRHLESLTPAQRAALDAAVPALEALAAALHEADASR